MKQILIISSATALLAAAAPAFAQGTLGAAVDNLTTSATGGMTMGGHATNKLDVEKSRTGNLQTLKLVGATVYDNKQNTTGKIEDLVIVEGKAVSGVIVSVGSLGIVNSYVLANPSSFALRVQDGIAKAYLDATKEQLQNAPKYTYKKS